MIRIAAITLALSGCGKGEPTCEGPTCTDSGTDPECTTSGPCIDGGVCDVTAGLCVECLENADCSDLTPICDATSHSCEACDAHADCASGVCDLPTGGCVDEVDVAYVATGGPVSADCARSTPCQDLVQAEATVKPVIHVAADVVMESDVETAIDRSVTVFAEPGASLTRTTDGPILSVSGDVEVTIHELDVFGAGNGDGLVLTGPGAELTLEHVVVRQNGGRGILANTGGRLTMRGCVVSGNLEGGANIQGLVVDITNTLFVRNGNTGANTGGVVADPAPGSIFAFNTIADNASLSADRSGVNCVNAFAASSNVVTNNALGPNCTFTHSLFDSTTKILPNGTGNLSGDPRFISTDPGFAAGSTYYRIEADSDAIDHGDPAAVVEDDIDGDPRPVGSAHDMGADEWVK